MVKAAVQLQYLNIVSVSDAWRVNAIWWVFFLQAVVRGSHCFLSACATDGKVRRVKGYPRWKLGSIWRFLSFGLLLIRLVFRPQASQLPEPSRKETRLLHTHARTHTHTHTHVCMQAQLLIYTCSTCIHTQRNTHTHTHTHTNRHTYADAAACHTHIEKDSYTHKYRYSCLPYTHTQIHRIRIRIVFIAK